MKKAQNIAGYGILLVMFLIIAIGFWYFTKNNKETLVGGCGGVAPWYIQECCDNWAKENNIVKVQCVGYWKIAEGKCSWDCGSPNNKDECLMAGGKWVDIEEIKNHNTNLNIKTTEICEKYGGSCSEMRIISSTTIGICDNGNDCWIADFWEDTCLLPK